MEKYFWAYRHGFQHSRSWDYYTVACAAPGHVWSTAASAILGGGWSTAACATPGCSCSTTICATPEHLCSTYNAYAAPWRIQPSTACAVCGPVWSTLVCAASECVWSTAVCAIPGCVCFTLVCAASERVWSKLVCAASEHLKGRWHHVLPNKNEHLHGSYSCIKQILDLKMDSAESGVANQNYAHHIQLSLAQPIGTRASCPLLHILLVLHMELSFYSWVCCPWTCLFYISLCCVFSFPVLPFFITFVVFLWYC